MIWKMLGHAQFQAVGRSPYLIPSPFFQAIAALGAVGNDGSTAGAQRRSREAAWRAVPNDPPGVSHSERGHRVAA